ncbi:MAG: GntR family transcriptional regulator [Lachnospiraceae bacterium]|nr:GntR family transcriptional regulator [Lachnospiraceae bacterium]
MIVSIDFDSDEALYIQLRNQIILRIAMAELRDGDSLPSVREMADDIGINMHTVNKAYSILRQEGYVKLNRRQGAVIALNCDKAVAIEEFRQQLRVLMARAICKNLSYDEISRVVEETYHEFM